MTRKKPVGWRKEHARHVAAGKGIKTSKQKAIQKRSIVPRGLKQFYSELRSLGFKREFAYRSIWPGNRIAQYTKKFERVKVNVQLFDVPTSEDYVGRVSHFHRGHTPFGVKDSLPSTFRTIGGMDEAINFEKTRHERGISKLTEKHF